MYHPNNGASRDYSAMTHLFKLSPTATKLYLIIENKRFSILKKLAPSGQAAP